jgi:hypothetical protein
MAVVSVWRILRRRVGGAVGLVVPQRDTGRLSFGQGLDASDSYWWILAGGIHVPGFGDYLEPRDET